MKRSEMIDMIDNIISQIEFGNRPHRSIAVEVLDRMERKGMLPPTTIKEKAISGMYMPSKGYGDFYTKEKVNIWEPEDDSLTTSDKGAK